MIKKVFQGNYLFVRDGCDYCKVAKKSILKINTLLPLNKQIIIVDCTYTENYGIITNSIIREFYDYLESYPTLFFNGIKKEGANSVLEYVAWLKIKLRNQFIIEEGNEYFSNIQQYAMHDTKCKKSMGRVWCKNEK